MSVVSELKHLPRRRYLLAWPVLAVFFALVLVAVSSVQAALVGYIVAGGLCGGVVALLSCFTRLGRYTIERPQSRRSAIFTGVVTIVWVAVLDLFDIPTTVLLSIALGLVLGQTAVLSAVYYSYHDAGTETRTTR